MYQLDLNYQPLHFFLVVKLIKMTLVSVPETLSYTLIITSIKTLKEKTIRPSLCMSKKYLLVTFYKNAHFLI